MQWWVFCWKLLLFFVTMESMISWKNVMILFITIILTITQHLTWSHLMPVIHNLWALETFGRDCVKTDVYPLKNTPEIIICDSLVMIISSSNFKGSKIISKMSYINGLHIGNSYTNMTISYQDSQCLKTNWLSLQTGWNDWWYKKY